MPRTGEPRFAGRIGIVIVLLVAGIAAWWWTHRRAGETPATSTIRQYQRGSASGTATAAARSAASAAPARLAITVIDDKGPLAGATVRLAPRDGEIVVVTAGGDGVAHADDLAPGTWRITASAAAHLPAALPAVRLAAGADEQRTIKLAGGGRLLRGTVSDATGGPIAGARIDAAALTAAVTPGNDVSTTITGSDGSYRLTVGEGALMVAAASADYAPQSRIVDVGPAGAVADFALVPGGVIEGVVRDERTRQPIEGAEVTAKRDSGAMTLAETATRSATTRADGRFRLGGLRPGAWDFSATAQTRHTRSSTIVGLGVAEQVSDVELLVGEAPVIRGRVVDDAGAPVPGVAVRAMTRGDSAGATADAAGAFVLEGLSPGSYLVTPASDVYLSAGASRVTLADKDVDVIVTVQRGTTLSGRVEPRQPCDIQSESSQPRRGMRMQMPSTASGADGSFTLGPFGNGDITLRARCTGGDQGSLQVTVSPGMPDVLLLVAPGASIAGRVVDGSGKPVAAIDAMASAQAATQRTTIVNGRVTSGVHGLTAADGTYKLSGLAAGTYSVSALDRGKPLRLRTPPPVVELAADEHRTGVDLAVDRPDGVIRGTVTGPDGKPLADAWVTAQQDWSTMLDSLAGGPGRPGAGASRSISVEASMDGSGADATLPPALTDASGHYELRGLPHARFSVVAEAQRGQLRARAADITPDATVDLQVLGVSSLSGRITGLRDPAAVFSVELDGPTRAQRSFTNGRYAFARVDPGSYTVRVQASDGNAEAQVTVTANQPATLDLTLTANAVVVGKLVDPTGAPVASQGIALVPDSGGAALAVRMEGEPLTTGRDGSFRLEHRAGRCALFVMRPPQPFSRRGLVLEAGKTLDLGTITLPAADAVPGPGSGGPPR